MYLFFMSTAFRFGELQTILGRPVCRFFRRSRGGCRDGPDSSCIFRWQFKHVCLTLFQTKVLPANTVSWHILIPVGHMQFNLLDEVTHALCKNQSGGTLVWHCTARPSQPPLACNTPPCEWHGTTWSTNRPPKNPALRDQAVFLHFHQVLLPLCCKA